MLNLRRINEFKYDIREALDSKQMDPAVKQTLIASVIAKASRQSIVEAKQYVRESQANGHGVQGSIGQHLLSAGPLHQVPVPDGLRSVIVTLMR